MSNSLPTLRDIDLVDAAPEKELDYITELTATLTRAPVALVSIVEADLDRQFFKSALGLQEPWLSKRETPLSHSFCQHVSRADKPFVVADARNNDLVRDNLAIPELGVVAYLGVPIHGVSGEPIGALCAIDGQPREWSGEDVDNLMKLASFVDDHIQLRASLMIKERQAERLLELATTDPLTSALNRRAFFDRLDQEISRWNRYRHPFGVALFDLDHFKQVNDVHGHDAGDAVLVGVSQRVAGCVRTDLDVFARVGGEEFAVLMPGVEINRSFQACERFRSVIAGAPFDVGRAEPISVTASFGVAAAVSDATSGEDLMKRADQALYASKRAGRNRVSAAADLDGDEGDAVLKV